MALVGWHEQSEARQAIIVLSKQASTYKKISLAPVGRHERSEARQAIMIRRGKHQPIKQINLALVGRHERSEARQDIIIFCRGKHKGKFTTENTEGLRPHRENIKTQIIILNV